MRYLLTPLLSFLLVLFSQNSPAQEVVSKLAKQNTLVTGTLTSSRPDLPYGHGGGEKEDLRGERPSTLPFQLSDRFIAGDPSTFDEFGWSVAIDGNTAIVGDEGEDVGNNARQGAAFIFERIDGVWLFQQRLVAPDGAAGNGLGVSVDVEGNTAVVSTRSGGKVYIFTRTGSTWLFQTQFISSDVEFFVNPIVSLSGNTLLVGCTNGNGVVVGSGTAYVFTRRGTTWSFEAELNASDGVFFDNFGAAIAINGNTALIGAYADDFIGNDNRGSVYVFMRSGSTWTQTLKLRGTPNTVGFGFSVVFDGTTALAGANVTPAADGFSQGSAYVFTRKNDIWSAPTEIRINDDPSAGNFGMKVALSGNTALIAAPKADIGTNTAQGSVYLFTNEGGMWAQRAKLLAPDGAKYDNFGRGLALLGNTAMVGANGDNFFGNTAPGSVYVFSDVSGDAPDLQAASDTGLSSTDNITKSNDPAFDISGVTPGARIELLRNNMVVSSAIAATTSATLTDHITVNGDYQYNWRQIIDNVASPRSTALLLTLDTVGPSVTINQAQQHPDPSTLSGVVFIVNVNDPLNDFTPQDVSLAGSTADISGIKVSGSGDGSAFGVQIDNIVSDGQMVIGTVPAGAFTDVAGNGNSPSTSTDNIITVDNVHPRVTINQAANQPDPSRSFPINFTVVFSEPVTNFDGSDVSLTGSTIITSNLGRSVTGSGTTYNVAVTGETISTSGLLRVTISSGAAFDWLGNGSNPSTSTDNEVTLDRIAPSVTLNQAPGQMDPASAQPVRFRAIFNEPVTGLIPSDISLAGSTANVSTAGIEVTGSGTTYDIAVTNISSGGEVRASIPSGGAQDAAGNSNTISTSTDNVVTVTIAASGTITGRVVNSSGRGVFKARVVLTITDGTKIYAVANPFGYFRFVDIPTGNITIEASRKAQQAPSRSVFLTGDLTDLNFTLQY